MQGLLQGAAEGQDKHHKWSAQQNDRPIGDPADSAATGGQPHASCGGESVDHFGLIAPNDDTRADKADPGHDSLNDAARIRADTAAHAKHNCCRTKRNEAQRAHARRFAVKVTVEPERDANHRCNDKAQRDIDYIHGDVPHVFFPPGHQLVRGLIWPGHTRRDCRGPSGDAADKPLRRLTSTKPKVIS